MVYNLWRTRRLFNQIKLSIPYSLLCPIKFNCKSLLIIRGREGEKKPEKIPSVCKQSGVCVFQSPQNEHGEASEDQSRVLIEGRDYGLDGQDGL